MINNYSKVVSYNVEDKNLEIQPKKQSYKPVCNNYKIKAIHRKSQFKISTIATKQIILKRIFRPSTLYYAPNFKLN